MLTVLLYSSYMPQVGRVFIQSGQHGQYLSVLHDLLFVAFCDQPHRDRAPLAALNDDGLFSFEDAYSYTKAIAI